MYDFIVVANGRSGSHLLASFLSSHPDICCNNHWGKGPDEIENYLRKGRVYTYRDFLDIKPVVPKVIHLVRNVDRQAFSCARNFWGLHTRPKLYLAHLKKGKKSSHRTLDFVAEKSDIERITKSILLHRKLVVEELMNRGIPVLELRYENITSGNKSVSKMPAWMSEMVAHFLCVDHAILTTDRIKIAPDNVKIKR